MKNKFKILILASIVLFLYCVGFTNAETDLAGETAPRRQSLGGLAAWEVVPDHLRPTSTRSVFAPNGLYASSTVLFDILTVFGGGNFNSITTTDSLYIGGLSTFNSGFISNASSTVIGGFTIDGNATTTGSATTTGIGTFSDVYIPDMQISTSTYRSINDAISLGFSAGRITGGEGSFDGDNQTYSILEGTGWLRIADDDISQLKLFDWSATTTIDTATGTAEYFGVEYNSGDPQVVVKSDNTSWNFDTDFPLGSVVNMSGTLYFNNNPFQSGDQITNINEWMTSNGYITKDKYIGGLVVSVTGTRNPTMSKGQLWSRGTESEITAKDCSGADTFYAWYRDGAGGWSRGDNASSSYSVLEYDDNSGTPVALTANRYASWWVWVTYQNPGELQLIYPQNQYSVVALAEAEAVPVFPTEWYEHGWLQAQIIIKQGADAELEILQLGDDMTKTAALAADHGNLSGLSDDDHSIYALLAATRGDQTFAGGMIFDTNVRVADLNATTTNVDTLSVYGNASTTGYMVVGTGKDDLLLESGDLFVSRNATTSGYLYVGGNATTTGHLASLGGNSDQWNLAFGWGDHSIAGYLTTVAYTDLTGNPSDVISAGTNLSWDGDTLNAAVDGSSNWTYGDSEYITPSTTIGVILNASSTVNSTLKVTEDLSIGNNATTTNHFEADSTLYVKDSQVGIGTASPTSTLQVSGGDVHFQGASGRKGMYWDTSATRLGLGTTAPGTEFTIDDGETAGDVAQAIIARNRGGAGGTYGNAQLLFGSPRSEVDGSYTANRGYIILTGESSAGANLFIGAQTANAVITGNAATLRASANQNMIEVSSGAVTFWSGGTAYAYIDSNSDNYFIGGQVGIGVTSPTAELDVGGGSLTTADGTDDLLVKDDIEVDGNIYVEGSIVSPTANIGGSVNIFTADYSIMTEGLHIGGGTDPGTDNLVVDGTTKSVGYVIGNSCAVAKTATFFGEEGADLTDASYEWSMGNGDDPTAGAIQPCAGKIAWMTVNCLACATTNSTVEIQVDTSGSDCETDIDTAGDIAAADYYGIDTTCSTTFSAGDALRGYTIDDDGVCAGCVISWGVQYN